MSESLMLPAKSQRHDSVVLRYTALVLALALAACEGASDDHLHPAELIGAWQQVDRPNPVQVTPEGGFTYAYVETSRTLTLDAAGHYSEAVTYACVQGTCPNVTPSELRGRWSAVDGTIEVADVSADGHPLEDGLVPPRPYALEAGGVLVFEGARFER